MARLHQQYQLQTCGLTCSVSRLRKHAEFREADDGAPTRYFDRLSKRNSARGCGRILVYVEIDRDFRLAEIFHRDTGLPPSHYRLG